MYTLLHGLVRVLVLDSDVIDKVLILTRCDSFPEAGHFANLLLVDSERLRGRCSCDTLALTNRLDILLEAFESLLSLLF